MKPDGLGRAIAIATAQVATAALIPGAPTPAYSSEQERSQKAIEVFHKSPTSMVIPTRRKPATS